MADVYIKPGTGTGTGTASDPYFYSQLSDAETAAGSGGTIFFTDGDYSFTTNPAWDSNGVTYKSLNRFGAKIIGSGSVRVLGIGGTGNTVAVKISSFLFEDFVFDFNPPQDTSIIQTLEYCKATHTTSTSSVLINGQSGSSDRALINFCEFSFKPSGTSFGSSTSNYTYKNSSFFFDLSATSGMNDPGTSAVISNNCIYSSNDNSKWSHSLATNATNCCFHNMGSTNSSGGTDNIFVDPVFVDPGSDLRLRPTSPCIGAGTAS
jgi:hypothetical protein